MTQELSAARSSSTHMFLLIEVSAELFLSCSKHDGDETRAQHSMRNVARFSFGLFGRYYWEVLLECFGQGLAVLLDLAQSDKATRRAQASASNGHARCHPESGAPATSCASFSLRGPRSLGWFVSSWLHAGLP